jgi:nitrate/nitrite transport system substrate-binding protein
VARLKASTTSSQTTPVKPIREGSQTSRRAFLAATGAAVGSAMIGCDASPIPKSESGSAVPVGTVASEGPETKSLKFGIIALTDCSPLIIAHEKGFFRKYGIEATISKGASWAAIRDSLSTGDIQGTHMLLGMPSHRRWDFLDRLRSRWSSPGF